MNSAPRDPMQPFGMAAVKPRPEDFAPPKRQIDPMSAVIPLCCLALTIALIWALIMTLNIEPASYLPLA